MKRKASQVTARLPDELLSELDAACELVGLDVSTVVKACLKAFVEEVKKNGEIRLPLAVVPKATKKNPASEIADAARVSSSSTRGRIYPIAHAEDTTLRVAETSPGGRGSRPVSKKR